jgi:hypothetical protein
VSFWAGVLSGEGSVSGEEFVSYFGPLAQLRSAKNKMICKPFRYLDEDTVRSLVEISI